MEEKNQTIENKKTTANIQVGLKPTNTENRKKSFLIRNIIIISSIVLIGILVFLIYWGATSETRKRNNVIEDIQNIISSYRESNDSYKSMYLYISNEYAEDDVIIDFLCSEIQKMCTNKEYELLHDFVDCIILDNYIQNDEILTTLIDCFNSSSTIEDALSLRDQFDKEEGYKGSYYSKDKTQAYEYWNTIQDKMPLSKNASPISTYIEHNSTQLVTATPGEGFYAEYENEYHREIIGIEGSPLYDAKSKTYFGDFMQKREYGVELDSYYQERKYDRSDFYFRGYHISFSPTSFLELNCEFVWSGDYLFCFSYNGTLLAYDYIPNCN